MKRKLYISPEYLDLLAIAMRVLRHDVVLVEESDVFLNWIKDELLARGARDLHAKIVEEEFRMLGLPLSE